jgi:DNA-directed RNA polymerase subunit RPC12/RpoP
MEAIASKISEYERAGKIWNANYEDAVLYLREAECASVTKTEKDGKIYVSVTHSLDKSIYDYPLTVKVKLDPSASGAAKVTQGDTVGYAYVKSEGDVKYACIDVKPNSEEAVVSIVELEDIPYDKIPEFGGGAVEHGCFDKNSDYYCDICKSMIAHNHVDADHDDICDLCKVDLPHVCYDADGDYICNKCENILPHNCIDENNDYVCDKCGKKMPHEHIDVNGDTNCDRCGINVSDEYDGGTENMTPDGWS